MLYKVDRILRDIRIAIDENADNERFQIEGDEDTLTLNDVIYSKIEEGVQRVHMMSLPQYLEEGHNIGDSIRWTGNGSGWVLLPDNFMRLIVFQMSDWERAVYEPLTISDPRYKLQSSRYKGIRGNFQKPVCAIVNRPEGKVIEFYSCKDETAHISQGSYLPYPKIDERGGIDISERCYRSSIYMTASLVMETYGMQEQAGSFYELSKSLIQ